MTIKIIKDSKTLGYSIAQTQLDLLALCIQATNSPNNGWAIVEATFIHDTDLAGLLGFSSLSLTFSLPEASPMTG